MKKSWIIGGALLLGAANWMIPHASIAGGGGADGGDGGSTGVGNVAGASSSGTGGADGGDGGSTGVGSVAGVLSSGTGGGDGGSTGVGSVAGVLSFGTGGGDGGSTGVGSVAGVLSSGAGGGDGGSSGSGSTAVNDPSIYVPINQTRREQVYGCFDITNNSPTGDEVYVPLLMQSEWDGSNGIKTLPPTGVGIVSCPVTCSGGEITGVNGVGNSNGTVTYTNIYAPTVCTIIPLVTTGGGDGGGDSGTVQANGDGGGDSGTTNTTNNSCFNWVPCNGGSCFAEAYGVQYQTCPVAESSCTPVSQTSVTTDLQTTLVCPGNIICRSSVSSTLADQWNSVHYGGASIMPAMLLTPVACANSSTTTTRTNNNTSNGNNGSGGFTVGNNGVATGPGAGGYNAANGGGYNGSSTGGDGGD